MMKQIAIALLCLSTSVAFASMEPDVSESVVTNPVVELKALLEPISSVSAVFSQQLYSADEYLIQDNTGSMQVSTPGKIRWIIDSPMEQWLIADGSTLWLYDPDLEQVIIKPFDQNIAAAPALLLTGSVGELADMFEVSESSQGEAGFSSAQSPLTRRFTLTPRGDQTLYEYFVFEFEGSTPVAIMIVDALGQRTHIVFSKVRINELIDPSRYVFSPPPGIDVIHHE